MEPFQFEAILKRPEGIGTWTYLDIPLDVAEVFGAKGQVKVAGTINGHPYRGSAMPHGDGTHYLVVNRSIREAIGAAQGDRVIVTLGPDTGARTVTIPADLDKAFAQNREAGAAFGALSYSHQKEFVDWIEQAKKAETRERRITQALEMLAEGSSPKRRKG